jgi:hypothetical protein
MGKDISLVEASFGEEEVAQGESRTLLAKDIFITASATAIFPFARIIYKKNCNYNTEIKVGTPQFLHSVSSSAPDSKQVSYLRRSLRRKDVRFLVATDYFPGLLLSTHR